MQALDRTAPVLPTEVTSWIAAWNENVKPYIWTKKAGEILANLAGHLTRLSQSVNDSGH